MILLRWCFLFPTLMVLSNCLSPDDSDCFLRQEKQDTTEIHCKSGNSSSGISIKLELNDSLTIGCDRTLDWLNLQYKRVLDPQIFKDFNFESCQFPESKQIDFIKKGLTLNNIVHVSLELLDINVASNVSRIILGNFTRIGRLSFSAMNFTNASSDYLDKFPHFSQLQLSRNILGRVPENLWKRPNRFYDLILHDNNLNVIGPNILSGHSMSVLHIKEKNLHQIEPKAFDDIDFVDIIAIEGGKLRSLPENLFATLPFLKFLILMNNDFSYNLLSPELLRNHSGLNMLFFKNNKQKLITLPNKFLANMTRLETVIITGFGLVTLPEDSFFGSNGLTTLEMNNNSIKSLPAKLFNDCEKLSSIDFHNNQIDVLPDGIFSNLKNLKSLNLSDNCMTTISSSLFNGLYSLETLNMEGNNLRTIEGNIWFHKLRIANFSHNYLTIENFSPYWNSTLEFVNIEELDFSYNHITNITDDWLRLGKLRNFNLQHNKIEKISERDLEFKSDNVRVDLRYNEIKEISMSYNEDVQQSIQGSREIYVNIGDNPIDCDCKIYGLLRRLEEIQSSLKLDVRSLKCEEPSWLKNTNLLSLKSETLTCLISEPHMINAECPEKCKCWRKPSNQKYIIDCPNGVLDYAPNEIKGPAEPII